MSTADTLFFIGSTNEYYHTVTLEIDGSAVTDATIVVNVLETDGNNFAGPFNSVNDGGGNYTVVIPSTVAFVDKTEYIYDAVITSGTTVKTMRQAGKAGYARQ